MKEADIVKANASVGKKGVGTAVIHKQKIAATYLKVLTVYRLCGTSVRDVNDLDKIVGVYLVLLGILREKDMEGSIGLDQAFRAVFFDDFTHF